MKLSNTAFNVLYNFSKLASNRCAETLVGRYAHDSSHSPSAHCLRHCAFVTDLCEEGADQLACTVSAEDLFYLPPQFGRIRADSRVYILLSGRDRLALIIAALSGRE
jgi:hypothetical protein